MGQETWWLKSGECFHSFSSSGVDPTKYNYLSTVITKKSLVNRS